MIHSELNALLNAETSVVGATIYITGHPCLHCYQCLLQARISMIVFDAREERNAVMIDEVMMDKIRKIEKLTNNHKDNHNHKYPILKAPYFYEPDIQKEYIVDSSTSDSCMFSKGKY